MTAPRAAWLALLAIAVPATAIYATRLGFAPIYLIHDEVNYALQAISIAQTGRDLNGRVLPLYFSEPEFPAGRDPMMIYATAAAVKLLPVSEAAVRLPTALVGVATVVVTFVAALWLFESTLIAAVAAAMLALTPALFIHSRLALSVLYPLPFIAGWVLCLRRFEISGHRRMIFIAGLLLGLSVYAYLAALVMLPVYVTLTLWFLAARGQQRCAVQLLLGLALAFVPLVLWQIAYPDRYAELFRSYRIEAPPAATAVAASWLGGLRNRVHEWWVYFDPAYLFISGDSSMTNSTRTAGCFPLAFAVLLPVGMQALWRRGPFGRLLIAAFATAPTAAILTGTVDLNRYRALFILPFAALLAAAGFERLWRSRHGAVRLVAAILVLTIAAQFTWFYSDYMGRYRESSSSWFGSNLKGAYLGVMSQAPAGGAVFVSGRIPFASIYWKFYAAADPSAAPVTPRIVGDGEIPMLIDAPDGSWLVAGAGEAWLTPLATQRWRVVTSITEPSGAISFLLYRKMPAA